MAEYLKTDVDDLVKMDSSSLVPLYNLINYHITRGAEECKHTESEWKSLLLADLLAEDSLYRSVGLAGLSDTERRKILQAADTMQLVILGCVNDVLGQAQIRDGGSEVSDREGRGEEGEEGEGEEMSEGRKKTVDEAFEKADRNGDGVITQEDLQDVFDVTKHPKYQSGEMTEQELFTQFLNEFESGGLSNGQVTWEEFQDYYSGISASIDNDAYFSLMIRNTWKV